MRVFVFFDLPTITTKDKSEYRKFRKHLIKSGFLMLQESVYCKLALNQTSVKTICDNLNKNKPTNGYVHVLNVTENQFSKSIFLIGENNTDVINSDERVIFL